MEDEGLGNGGGGRGVGCGMKFNGVKQHGCSIILW